MALYESEHTIFMREMMAKHPEWAEDQLVGRALLWDKQVDRDAQAEDAESRVPQRPYVYQTGPK